MTPAEELRAAAQQLNDQARLAIAEGHDVRLSATVAIGFAKWLYSAGVLLAANTPPDGQPVLAPLPLAVARAILGQPAEPAP